LEQVYKYKWNLYIAYIDYRKAFDSVPQSWLIHVLQIHKIEQQVINSLQQLTMNEDDMCWYLGNMQRKGIKHAPMKQKLGEENLNRTKAY